MLMVDTSVWVDFFNGASTRQTQLLQARLGRDMVVLGDLILTEILQGFKADRPFKQAREALREFPVLALVGEDMALQAAIHYRMLRKKGVTIRKTIDVWIATYCIQENIPLLYSDKDFDPMVRHLGLKNACINH